jgi:hypothetical protein
MPARLLVLSLSLLLGMLGWSVCASLDEKEAPELHGVTKGMNMTEVRAKVREPKRIARQFLFRRHLEQWTYEAPIDLLVEFNCVRGEKEQVVSVHSLRSKKH